MSSIQLLPVCVCVCVSLSLSLSLSLSRGASVSSLSAASIRRRKPPVLPCCPVGSVGCPAVSVAGVVGVRSCDRGSVCVSAASGCAAVTRPGAANGGASGGVVSVVSSAPFAVEQSSGGFGDMGFLSVSIPLFLFCL